MAQLIQIHKPAKMSDQPRVIFIHGLDGDVRKTWMANKKDAKTLWPKWIGEELGCPVWLLGYVAPKTRWSGDAMAVPFQASAILELLSSEQEIPKGPVVLVGHSLGGLIIKTAIQHGMSQGVERYERLIRKVRGVVFVGTPHSGSWLANLMTWFRVARSNPQMHDLTANNANLITLNNYFLNQKTELGFKTRVFVETQPCRIPYVGRLLPGITIVNPNSSNPNVPGEVGIPVDAHHLNICKPKDRNSLVHTSVIAFIKDIMAELPTSEQSANSRSLLSKSFEAIPPMERMPLKMHMAFVIAGDDENMNAGVCASVCITTDEPARLRDEIQGIRKKIQNDPLINLGVKSRAVDATLAQLVSDPATQVIALHALSIISFSAYLYYCPVNELKLWSHKEKIRKIIAEPLVHRFSKRREYFEQFSTRISDFPACVDQAAAKVYSEYHREVTLPVSDQGRYRVVEELAELTAQVCSSYLSGLGDPQIELIFENLRTRIRFATNVATGEKHTRDVNPLP